MAKKKAAKKASQVTTVKAAGSRVNDRQDNKIKKEIVLYDTANRTEKRFNLLDVESIEYYDGATPNTHRVVVFLDDGTYHECTHFEIEVVE